MVLGCMVRQSQSTSLSPSLLRSHPWNDRLACRASWADATSPPAPLQVKKTQRPESLPSITSIPVTYWQIKKISIVTKNPFPSYRHTQLRTSIFLPTSSVFATKLKLKLLDFPGKRYILSSPEDTTHHWLYSYTCTHIHKLNKTEKWPIYRTIRAFWEVPFAPLFTEGPYFEECVYLVTETDRQLVEWNTMRTVCSKEHQQCNGLVHVKTRGQKLCFTLNCKQKCIHIQVEVTMNMLYKLLLLLLILYLLTYKTVESQKVKQLKCLQVIWFLKTQPILLTKYPIA